MSKQEITELLSLILDDAAIERLLNKLKNNNLTIRPIENDTTRYNFTSDHND